MSNIGKLLPEKVKRSLIKLSYLPEKIMLQLYYDAADHKYPCPDKLFQKWDYKIHTKRKLNFKNPVTYQDKLQWLKYYYHDPLYTKLVDKYAVREWVAEKIGEEYLVPLYGVYDSFDEIDFDKLPNEFVLKCTHDSGSVVICKDKSKFDFDSAREKLTKGLKSEHFYKSREWPYKNVPHRIICEKYLKDDKIDDAPDYKFFCFDGKVKFMIVNSERHSETGVKTNYYTPDFERTFVKEAGFASNPKDDIKPDCFEKMIELAEFLSQGMPHVRVDFNCVNGFIYFGEMTFYHCGGRMLYEPDEYNYLFGEYLNLPKKKR